MPDHDRARAGQPAGSGDGRHDLTVKAHAHHVGDHAHGPLTLEQRHAHEAETYDEISKEILGDWNDALYLVDRDQIPFANREHVEFLTEAVRRLGPLHGTRVLEVGAGGGSLAVWLALQGAEVVGIDVSSGILEVAARRAAINGVSSRCRFVHAPVETFDPRDHGLDFARFDAIIGNNVMHHFQRDLAMANLGRLLAPGAVAVFCEPVLFLPELAWTVRNSRLVTRRFPLHTHSPDERSLGRGDFEVFERWFRHVEWAPFQLLCRLQNFVELSDRAWDRLEQLDRGLLRRLPGTRHLCRIAVIELGLPRPGADTADPDPDQQSRPPLPPPGIAA